MGGLRGDTTPFHQLRLIFLYFHPAYCYVFSFQKLRAEIGVVQATATDFNYLRDELVNHHPNCDSTELDQNVNAVNTRLMDASQKLSDRQGKLEEALVQCGQFSDAVESLIRWLEETQELVEGQGSISAADPNVLKAQIMEQKVLNRSNVSLVKEFMKYPLTSCDIARIDRLMAPLIY